MIPYISDALLWVLLTIVFFWIVCGIMGVIDGFLDARRTMIGTSKMVRADYQRQIRLCIELMAVNPSNKLKRDLENLLSEYRSLT